MIRFEFMDEQLKHYSELCSHMARKGSAKALAYELTKNNLTESQVKASIDNMIRNSEKMGLHEIMKNIPKGYGEQQSDQISSETKARAHKEWAETKIKCVGDYDCVSCRIEYCSIHKNVLLGNGKDEKGLIMEMVGGEVNQAQALGILMMFKGINWGLDIRKKETRGIQSFTKKANSFKWEKG